MLYAVLGKTVRFLSLRKSLVIGLCNG